MKSPHKKANLITLAIVLSTLLSLIACTEKPEDSNKAETVIPPMPEDNLAQLQREAQEGDPDAQYNLAYRYENGLGLPKNEAKALELYQKAADQGHSEAQNNLDAMKTPK